MRKVFITAAIIGAIGLAGMQTASARGWYGNGGNGYCNNYNAESSAGSAEQGKALEQFRAATETIRRSIVVKKSELDALLLQDNPDEKRVAELTGELYDLGTQLDKKAATEGLDRGPGMMWGNGWNNGRHMLGW